MNDIKTVPGGWHEEEDTLLFDEVEQGRKRGMPLKAVFESVAKKTGRRPNSIRNYYYQRIKTDDRYSSERSYTAAFTPFTDDETRMLLRTVLSEQARGVSVRACTLAMGDGDTKAMLRYQNKYRSLLRTDPECVKFVMAELESEGIHAFDPYSEKPVHRAGRPKKSTEDIIDVMSDVVSDLSAVKGFDVTAFFESMGALALAASREKTAVARVAELEAGEGGENTRLSEQNMRLRAELKLTARTLMAERDRFNTLLSLYRRLIGVNRDFLRMTGVTKMSSLSNYIRELTNNVEACDRFISEG